MNINVAIAPEAATVKALNRIVLIADTTAIIVTVCETISIICLGAYLGWQALTRKQQYGKFYQNAIDLSCRSGTSLRNVNLTDANLTQAIFNNTDFRGAKLETVNLIGVKLVGAVMPNGRIHI